MKFTIRCPVYPTEDSQIVVNALENFLKTASLDERPVGQNRLEITASSEERDFLHIIRQIIHQRKIIDAVRTRILANWNGLDASFVLFDKQAAIMRKLKLVDNREEVPPLGAIRLECTFASDAEFDDFLSWFVPPTENGHVLDAR
ncbi:MAG: RNA-binding domain-containing protein [Candidatus Thorarchaeota archaeon]